MSETLSQDEIALRIAALLCSRRTGQAVADYIEERNAVPPRRAAPSEPRMRRFDDRTEVAAACSGT